jgi:uncharacterized iron-regulated membrane protein
MPTAILNRKKKYSVKKLTGWLHLWMGLFSGSVLFLSMIGAAIFVWEKELTDWYYADLIFNEEEEKSMLPVSALHEAASTAYPDKEFSYMRQSAEPGRNVSFQAYKKADAPGWTWPSGIEHYLLVFVNPYTGEVIGHLDKTTDWITYSRFLHQTLLLEHELGSSIIGAAVLIMLALAVTGLVLWWPKNRKVLKQRLKVKWNARFRRLNWDVHGVGGFYTYLFLIFFASTGLVWSYNWWSNGIYWMFGNERSELFIRPTPPEIKSSERLNNLDKAYLHALSEQGSWRTLRMRIPTSTQEKGFVSVRMAYDEPNSWWSTSNTYFYDPSTGKLADTFLHKDKLPGEKWRNSNYDMHVGSIYGLPTKIIAFVCALFFAVLPVSGFLIWWGRKNKKRPETGKVMTPGTRKFTPNSKVVISK